MNMVTHYYMEYLSILGTVTLTLESDGVKYCINVSLFKMQITIGNAHLNYKGIIWMHHMQYY